MYRSLSYIVIICILLCGCSEHIENTDYEHEEKEVYTIDESLDYVEYTSDDGIFRVVLYVEEGPYIADNNIEIYSTLEYIGNKESIEIWHGIPYFNYQLSNGEDSFSDGLTLNSLNKSVLNKNEVYIKPFVKNGGWSADQEDSEFWEEYYKEEELKLPIGTYTLIAYCNFSLSKDSDDYTNVIEVNIVVEE